MDIRNKDTQQKLIGFGASLVFHGLVVALLLVLGLRYPDPPPPELGVEMDLGEFSDIGTDLEHAAEGGEDVSESNVVPDDNSGEVTQDAEDVPLESKKTESKKDKPKQNVKQEKPKAEEPQINQNALFSKGKVKKGSGSNTGVGNGDGKGSGGDGEGNGTSFYLAGRGKKSLEEPSSSTEKVGDIIVEIKVDQNGNVVEAKTVHRGTTLWDSNLWRLCEQAARKSKFTANPDAPVVQKGTITYIFR